MDIYLYLHYIQIHVQNIHVHVCKCTHVHVHICKCTHVHVYILYLPRNALFMLCVLYVLNVPHVMNILVVSADHFSINLNQAYRI